MSEKKRFFALIFRTRETEGGQDNLRSVELFPGVASDKLSDFSQVINPHLKH